MKSARRWLAALVAVMLVAPPAMAAPPATVPAQGSLATLAGPGLTPPLKLLALLTLLSLLPAIVMTMTSFLRTIIVLSFVRQGIGAQQVPPNQVLIGIAIFMTVFTMAPIATQISVTAYEPYAAGLISEEVAIERGSAPLRSFMLRQTREADLALFFDAARAPLPKTEEEVPMRIAIPAFVVSELTTGFQMGVLVLLPFLVIELAVSSVLMSMGMMMVPPSSIALPLKLLLFVVADGWNLIIGSLLRSFG
ncbi:MAG: flagellar type III secretion system pore protein FliP [Polyangiaceae bacterium]